MVAIPATLVHQRTTTTGTGNITLTDTGAGRQTFNTAFGTGSNTNVFDYYISHLAAAEWEHGTGHLSGAATLVRDTVIEGSNGGSLVNFSAGIKDVTSALAASRTRQIVTTGANFYVRTDGSNSNNGLANNAAGAWLTLQYAVNYIIDHYDLGNEIDCNINIGAGTFDGVHVYSTPRTINAIRFIGSGSGSTIISTVNTFKGFYALHSDVYIEGVTIDSTGQGGGSSSFIQSDTGANLVCGGDIAFKGGTGFSGGAGGFDEMFVCNDGGTMFTFGGAIAANLSGSAKGIIRCENMSRLIFFTSITLTGSPAWTVAAVRCERLSAVIGSSGITGTATGNRYTVRANAIIDTETGNANLYAGDVAGTTATGGIYT